MPEATAKQLQAILLVEDNPQDREATKRAFARTGIVNPIIECEDGEEALDYLYRRGKYFDPETAPRPALILLDLNMPGTDGFEILEKLKGNSELKNIPVVILTTSADKRDINKCYKSGANSYIQKPVDFEKFARSIERLKEYWLEIAILPKGDE